MTLHEKETVRKKKKSTFYSCPCRGPKYPLSRLVFQRNAQNVVALLESKETKGQRDRETENNYSKVFISRQLD